MTRVDLARLSDVSAGIASGTAFPGSPSTNDLFRRTDLALVCYYDGTRWLAIQEQYVDISLQTVVLPYSATAGTAAVAAFPYSGVRQIYVTRAEAGFFVNGGTALSASHKWVGTVNDDAGGNFATLTIDSGATSAWRLVTATVNAVKGSSATHMEVTWTKTGTPGTLYAAVRVYYRQIAT